MPPGTWPYSCADPGWDSTAILRGCRTRNPNGFGLSHRAGRCAATVSAIGSFPKMGAVPARGFGWGPNAWVPRCLGCPSRAVRVLGGSGGRSRFGLCVPSEAGCIRRPDVSAESRP